MLAGVVNFCQPAEMKHTFCAQARKAVMASFMPVAELTASKSEFLDADQAMHIEVQITTEVSAWKDTTCSCCSAVVQLTAHTMGTRHL